MRTGIRHVVLPTALTDFVNGLLRPRRRLRRGRGAPSRGGRGRTAARECGAERSRGDRPNAARLASAMYRRARPPGLAESLRVQLARSGGVRHLALQAGDRQRAALPHGRATSDGVATAGDVLNRMLELGRPEYVRIA